MIDPPEGPSYYLRFETQSDYLNLLYIPHADFSSDQINQSLIHLFRAFAADQGTIAYYSLDEHCIIVLRSKDIDGLRLYQYDDEAPYEGLYLDGRFVEALGEFI